MDTLARKLEATHDEIQRVRSEVVETLRAFYSTSSALSVEEALQIASQWTPDAATVASQPQSSSEERQTGTSDMDHRIQRLTQTLMQVVGAMQLDRAEDAGEQAQLIGSFAKRERLKRQMEQSQRMLVLVEQVTELDNMLLSVDTQMDQGNLVGAAEATAKAQQLIAALTGSSSENASKATEQVDVLTMLSLQLAKKKNRVVYQLKRTFDTALSATRGEIRARKLQIQQLTPSASSTPSVSSSPASSAALTVDASSAMWRAAEIMELCDPRLLEVAKMLAENVIKPLFHTDEAVVKVSQEADGVSLSVIRDESAVQGKSEADCIALKCGQVLQVMRFLHSDVVAADAELMQRLGDLLWKSPGNIESQLLNYLQDKIPKDTAAVNSYRDTVSGVTIELEKSLAGMGSTALKNSQLRHFSRQINEMYAKKRRQQLLSNAREILGRDYRNSLKVTGATERCNLDASTGSGTKTGSSKMGIAKGGSHSATILPDDVNEVESGFFRMPDYRVSNCAHDVVELAHQTLVEACTSEAVCANTLFQTSRDILFLFRAIVPTLHQAEISNDARTCMLYHNDCMYIAHHMLTIGHHYKARLPGPLGQMATMVDMVPGFREAGERVLLSFAKMLVDELLSGTKSFASAGGVDSESALLELESSFKSALYKINHIYASWQDGLPDPVYNKVMGRILDPLVTSFMDRMLSESQIPASAASKLYNLSSLLLECESVFLSPAQAEKHIPTVTMLRQFSQLLVQPLATIQDQYLAGDLAVFSSTELAALVRSLFRDSPERRELLGTLST